IPADEQNLVGKPLGHCRLPQLIARCQPLSPQGQQSHRPERQYRQLGGLGYGRWRRRRARPPDLLACGDALPGARVLKDGAYIAPYPCVTRRATTSPECPVLDAPGGNENRKRPPVMVARE